LSNKAGQKREAVGPVTGPEWRPATGPNTQGGGKRDTRGHYDVPMRDCTIELDGKAVVERGRIVDSKMKVNREAR
jgi:2,5-dihydroxypyridine 5,6-dioxygenase